MFPKIYIYLITMAWVILCIDARGQTVVGMGTESPNPNAVLELVSQNQNQGFLVPRLTTGQRNAPGFVAKLTHQDNGLLVFDTDEGSFYFWHEGAWRKGNSGQHTMGAVWYVGDGMPNSGQGEEGDFYLHQATGDLYRKQDHSFILLGNLQKDEQPYAAGAGIAITDQHEIINTGDLDTTNELQSLLSVLQLGNDAGGKVIRNLADPSLPQDAATKAYVTMQISSIPVSDNQTLSLNAGEKTLSISGGNMVELSSVDTDAQTLSFSGGSLAISGGNSVNINSINTDHQLLSGSKSGEAVTLSIDHGNSISFSVADNDHEATNEIQDLSLTAHSLKVTNNLSATAIDLSPYLDNTDAQTLSLSGNTLSISNGNTVDLSGLDTDSQVLSLSGDTLSITHGNAVDISSINTDEQALSFSGTTLGLSGSSTTVDLSVLQDGTGTDSQSLSSSKTATDVSVTISGGNTTTFSVADHDDDATNEKITSATLVAGDILRIQEGGSDHDVDLSGFQKTALPTEQILVGNALGVASPVSISGDVTLQSDGTMTITLDAVTTAKIIDNAITAAKLADDAVTKDKIHADVAGNGLVQHVDGSLEVHTAGGGLQLTTDQLQLTNQGNGQILIGDGSQVNAHTMSGDVTLANTGAVTVTKLQGNAIASAAPAANEVLTWNGSAWVPAASRSNSEMRWFTGTIDPQSTSFGGGEIGDLFYKYDENRYWRRTGTNPGDWTEIIGPTSMAPNGQRMNGQLNIGAAPAPADRQVGMLWLDDSANGRIRMWTGTAWLTLVP